jgi:hypothetical protein
MLPGYEASYGASLTARNLVGPGIDVCVPGETLLMSALLEAMGRGFSRK